MKNILIVIVVLSLLVFTSAGCAKKDVDTEEIRGEWKVVSVNSPKVLAEKDGKRRVFMFRAPHETTYFNLIKLCRKVEAGWIIQVESSQRYHFFPPVKR